MKLATYNVNGINGRLPVLLRWLEQSKPDVVCLQELKAPQEKFPIAPSRSPVTGQFGTARKLGTALLSWRAVANLTRPGEDCPAISKTLKAGTSKP